MLFCPKKTTSSLRQESFRIGVAWNCRTAEASCRARRRLSHWSIRLDCCRPDETCDIEEKI